MSLDKRLKEILMLAREYLEIESRENALYDAEEAIKQAFIEEDWRDLGSIGADFYDYDKKRLECAEGVDHE